MKISSDIVTEEIKAILTSYNSVMVYVPGIGKYSTTPRQTVEAEWQSDYSEDVYTVSDLIAMLNRHHYFFHVVTSNRSARYVD